MKKRIISAFMAFIMVFAMVTPLVNADNEKVSNKPDAVTKTVTLHKLIMSKEELKKWDSDAVEKGGYDGTQDLTGLNGILQKLKKENVKEIDKVYFALKFAKDYVNQDVDGNVTPGDYVKKGNDPLTPKTPLESTKDINEAVGGLTADDGIKFITSDLKGKFEIDEIASKSTYKGKNGESLAGSKAVPVEITLPLVNSEGTVLDAHVYPKNTEDKPEIDKNFLKESGDNGGLKGNDNFQGDNQKFFTEYNKYQEKKATLSATVGKKVPYEVKTKVKSGTSYGKLVWNDTMTNGLTFNKDLKIVADNGIDLTKGEDYKLVEDDRGFRLSLTDTGLKKVSEKTKPGKNSGVNVEFTITYSATVNGTAIVDNPEKNNISLEYGHRPDKKIEEKPVKPQNGNLEVKKTWSDASAPKEVYVTYTLKKGEEVKASVTLNSEMKETSFDLGNGIKFEVKNKQTLSGKFTGLEDGSDWKILERVSGYTPEYIDVKDGEVSIRNNKDTDNPTPLKPTSPEVVVGGKKFVKTDNKDAESATRLTGAKFIIKDEAGKLYLHAKNDTKYQKEQNELKKAKDNLNTLIDEWNKLDANAQKEDQGGLKGKIDKAQQEYNNAFKKSSIRYEWKPEKTGDTLVELSSDSQGRFEIQGLAYGKYKLEEIIAPNGYAKISDVDFTVKKGSYDNSGDINYVKENAGTKDAQQVKNKKISIPQTGGIGTIIFTIAGLAIMGGAIYALKKNNKEVEA